MKYNICGNGNVVSVKFNQTNLWITLCKHTRIRWWQPTGILTRKTNWPSSHQKSCSSGRRPSLCRLFSKAGSQSVASTCTTLKFDLHLSLRFQLLVNHQWLFTTKEGRTHNFKRAFSSWVVLHLPFPLCEIMLAVADGGCGTRVLELSRRRSSTKSKRMRQTLFLTQHLKCLCSKE